MGRGISASIPLIIQPRTDNGEKYFSDSFFQYYNKSDDNGIFTIKENLLLENYSSFLAEFYEIIGEQSKLESLNVPDVSTFEEFEVAFTHRNRNGRCPFLYEHSGHFSFLGGESSYYWNFYSACYDAYVEVYSIFLHFERILQKTIKNPLADLIKFGLFG